MSDASHTHREIVAAVASLKSCLRSVILAVSPPAATASSNPPTTSSNGKIQGSIQRASDAVSKLQGLLSAVADQTLRLPLETSKRLVDVGLPDLLQQLLVACQLNAAWPAPGQAPTQASTDAVAAPADLSGPAAGEAATASVATTAPAALHPSWVAAQQLLQDVFSTLAVLTSVLIRACTRSHDPAMVLMQLASPAVMEAQVAYLHQLKQHAVLATQAADAADSIASHSIQCAPACVAAFTSIYGLLVTATDAQTGLDELRQQLVTSLCATQLLPVAAEVLLLLPVIMQPEQQQTAQVQAECQAAGWSLLSLTLFLSGTGISIIPATLCIQPGQPLPSSMLAASIRAEAEDPVQPLDLAAAFSAAVEPSVAAVREQLLSRPVLTFLQERLFHCITELRGSYGSSSTTLAAQQKVLKEAAAARQLLLLPGRSTAAEQDVLHAALRVLRCWRTLLLGPAAHSLPLVGGFGMQLLLTLLSGVLAEPIRASSSEREALRGRVIRVAVHCLQLMCSCLSQDVLFQQVPALTVALAGVVSTAGAYWDSNRRAVKSEALPYTGQVRCVDKSTGDMMVRYTMAAQSALDLLRQLLTACRAYAAMPVGDTEAGGARLAAVMLSAGVLPAVEQLFRQLPVVSPAHVTASVFLVELLPLCVTADLEHGQLPLLATLRKFIVKSAGIPEPDREAGMLAATQFVTLLGTLAAAYASSHTAAPGGPADVLLRHAAVQLLPALQVYVAAVLKSPIPAPYSTALSSCSVAATAAALSSAGNAAQPTRTHLLPVMLAMYDQLAVLACTAPHLQLGPILLSSLALPTVADILSSNYWLLPGFQAAANSSGRPGRASPVQELAASRSSSAGAAAAGSGSSGGGMFSGECAAQLAVHMLEGVLACSAAAATTSCSAPQHSSGGRKGLHPSCSSDCLCALRRSEGNDSCPIGNPKCGLEGWCCCGSPKACSDITPQEPVGSCRAEATSQGTPTSVSADIAPMAGAAAASGQQDLPGQQQLLLVLSGLVQSKVLTELLRVVQAAGADASGASPKPDSSAGGLLGGFSRPSSANGLTVNVPNRSRGSVPRDLRGGLSPSGVSPKAYSPLGHSAPPGAALTSSLRSQTSATQAFLTAYSGGEPFPALGASSSSSNLGAGLRLTANPTSRFASTGSGAAPGSSPRHDDGAYGLLRAGSSGSSINWAVGTSGASLLQEAGVRMVARDSSGYGSSPSLASLASPLGGACADEASPFGMAQQDGGTAAGGSAPGAAPCGTSQLQLRLESLMLAVAQAVLVLADAGLLGSELLQRRPSGSADGDSSSAGGATPPNGNTPKALPRPALFSTGSGSVGTVGSGYTSLLTAGVSKLPSVGSGTSGFYASYLQSTGGPRTSFSGSGHYGNVSAEDVVSGMRSCLAAAGAAGVVPASNARISTAGAGATTANAKEAVSAGSPIGAQQGAIPVGQVVLGSGRQGSTPLVAASPEADVRCLSAEPSDVIFPVELGLSQLNITPAATTHPTAAAPTAPPCTPATPALLGAVLGPAESCAGMGVKQVQVGLPLDVLRRLQGALAAAGPLLARQSAPLEAEVLCPQVVLAKLSPRPLGCWNPSCTNMPGLSEAGAVSKPCTSCKVAAFCSKACEKQAWSEHTMACSRLAALAAAAADA